MTVEINTVASTATVIPAKAGIQRLSLRIR
jgi:hypothetical protein